MKSSVTTRASGTEYLSLDDAKVHLRITGTDSDNEITDLISAAVGILNGYLGFAIDGSEVTIYTDSLNNSFQYTSITSIKYLSEKDTYTDIGAYDAYEVGRELRIVPETSPSLYDYGFKYEFKIVQGFTSSTIPPNLVTCIKLILTDLDQQRGDQLPVNLYKIPRGVEAIAFNDSWRVFT